MEGNGVLIKYKSGGCWGLWIVNQTIIALNVPLKNKNLLVLEVFASTVLFGLLKICRAIILEKKFIKPRIEKVWVLNYGRQKDPRQAMQSNGLWSA